MLRVRLMLQGITRITITIIIACMWPNVLSACENHLIHRELISGGNITAPFLQFLLGRFEGFVQLQIGKPVWQAPGIRAHGWLECIFHLYEPNSTSWAWRGTKETTAYPLQRSHIWDTDDRRIDFRVQMQNTQSAHNYCIRHKLVGRDQLKLCRKESVLWTHFSLSLCITSCELT